MGIGRAAEKLHGRYGAEAAHDGIEGQNIQADHQSGDAGAEAPQIRRAAVEAERGGDNEEGGGQGGGRGGRGEVD